MTYGLIDYLSMFGGSFFVVFLLGIQSRNVQAGRYIAAIVTSFGISISQFMFVKYAATGNLAAFFTLAIAGCCGIAASIWFYNTHLQHRHIKK